MENQAAREPDMGILQEDIFKRGNKVGEKLANIIVECAKYLMIILITMYTYECFTVFRICGRRQKAAYFAEPDKLMFMIHFLAFAGCI